MFSPREKNILRIYLFLFRVMGVAGTNPSYLLPRVGYTLDSLPNHAHRDKQPFILIDNLDSGSDQPNPLTELVFVFVNPCTQRENDLPTPWGCLWGLRGQPIGPCCTSLTAVSNFVEVLCIYNSIS